MPVQIPDLRLKLYEMMRDRWNTDNTLGVTPDFHTGWLNKKNTSPQLTVTGFDDTVSGGGESGYSGFSNEGPMQFRVRLAYIDCWAMRIPDSGWNPKALVHDMAMEAERLIYLNWREDLGGYDSVAVRSIAEIPPVSDEGSVWFRFRMTVGGFWRREPGL